jgi:hypothetical protein
MIVAATALATACLFAGPTAGLPDPFEPRASVTPAAAEDDPFMAGGLGLMPFVSGLYFTEKPAAGLVFTLVDVVLALGMYTSLQTRNGDPDHFPTYVYLLGANNLLDAYFSARAAQDPLHARVTMRPEGGVEYSVRWKF